MCRLKSLPCEAPHSSEKPQHPPYRGGPHVPALQFWEKQSVSEVHGQPCGLSIGRAQGSVAAATAVGAVMDMITGRAIAAVNPNLLIDWRRDSLDCFDVSQVSSFNRR